MNLFDVVITILVPGLIWMTLGYGLGVSKANYLASENRRLKKKVNDMEAHISAMSAIWFRTAWKGERHQSQSQSQKRHWSKVLGLHGNVGKADMIKAYHSLAKKYHPDSPGGSAQKMKELNVARDEFMAEWRAMKNAA